MKCKVEIRAVMSAASLALVALLIELPAAYASPVTRVVALTGDPAPDGNGILSRIRSPVVLNDAGQVAFKVFYTGTSSGAPFDETILLADGQTLTQVVRAERLAPDGDGRFASQFSNPVLNDAGQVAFWGAIVGTASGESGGDIIAIGDGDRLTPIVRRGDAAPDGDGTFFDANPRIVHVNDAGQVSLVARFNGPSGVGGRNAGILIGDGAAQTQIAREEQAAPDGDGVFSSFGLLAVVNESGQVAFAAGLDDTSGGLENDRGIWRGDADSLVEIAREGDAAPDGIGTLGFFSSVRNTIHVLNDVGQVAFDALFNNTSGGSTDDSGLLRGDGDTLVLIAREGQLAPDGNGLLGNSLRSNPALNNAGQVAFQAGFTGTSGGLLDDAGILRGDGTTLLQIARGGEAAPDGNGVFIDFGPPAINDAGQIAFEASFGDTDGSDDREGILFYDDSLGLLQVARVGDSFLGSTISRVFFASSDPPFGWGLGDEQSGFNESGVPRVAYHFTLADGREGVAIWTLPEPATWLLLLLASPLFLRRRT